MAMAMEMHCVLRSFHRHAHVQQQEPVLARSRNISSCSASAAAASASAAASCVRRTRRRSSAVGCSGFACSISRISSPSPSPSPSPASSPPSSSSSSSRPAPLSSSGPPRQAQEENIVIVGGGISGLATALALHRLGLKPLVLEQSEELKVIGSSLGVWTNGWKALEALGVADSLREKFDKLASMEVYDSDDNRLVTLDFTSVSRTVEFRAVERKALLEALREPLPETMISYNADVIGIRKLDSGHTEVECRDGWRIKTKVLIGCDGARSIVARWMGFREPRFAGYTATRGLADFPQGHGLNFAARQILGRGVRAGLVPLDSHRLYWFVCFNDASALRVKDPELVRKETLKLIEGFSNKLIAEAVKGTPSEGLSRRKISDRWMWPLGGPPLQQGGVTLAGDAMHPITPNLGQGGCCAMEDAVVLARALFQSIHGSSNASTDMVIPRYDDMEAVEQALQAYTEERSRRMLPIGIRSYAIGSLLQNDSNLFCYARNWLVPKVVNVEAFVNHTFYDCGSLA